MLFVYNGVYVYVWKGVQIVSGKRYGSRATGSSIRFDSKCPHSHGGGVGCGYY